MNESTRRENIRLILEFEEDCRLLEYVIPEVDVPIWPFVRTEILINMEKDCGWRDCFALKACFSHEKIYEEMTIRNPYNSEQRDIVYAFFQNNFMDKDKDGKVFEDRYYSYMQFCEEKSTTLIKFVFETEFGFKSDCPDWKSDYAITLEAERNKKGTVDAEGIRAFVNFIAEKFPYKFRRDQYRKIMRHACWVEEQLMPMIKACERYLDIVRPKLVVVFWAHGMVMPNVAMILACKRKNIVTAEIQGVMFADYVLPCNWGNMIMKNEKCKKLFPDYVLTLGEYWNKILKSPSKRYVVGNAKLAGIEENPDNNNILIATGDDLDKYEKFIEDLFKIENMEFTIYFRIYPPLAHMKKCFDKFKKFDNFHMANDSTLAYYIKQCGYVITEGEGSVLYEALAFGRGVFALGSGDELNVTVKDVYRIRNAAEFLTLWEKRETIERVKHVEYYDMNWKENYTNFLNMVGIGKGTTEK